MIERLAIEIRPDPYAQWASGVHVLRVEVLVDGRCFQEQVALAEDEMLCQFDQHFELARQRLKAAILERRKHAEDVADANRRAMATIQKHGKVALPPEFDEHTIKLSQAELRAKIEATKDELGKLGPKYSRETYASAVDAVKPDAVIPRELR